MAMKVLHNTCNMCIHHLPDINVLIPLGSPCALSICTYHADPHIRVTAITPITVDQRSHPDAYGSLVKP